MLWEASKTKRILVRGLVFSFSGCPWPNPPDRKAQSSKTIKAILFNRQVSC
jgi:hypothetical protein